MEDGTAINKISKIMPSSYADCIIMGYDVTNKQSFEDIKTYWIDKIKNRSNIDLIYLLGNKIDLKDKIEVDENEAKEFADKNNIKYFQISVKNDINIQNFINDLKMNIETIDDNSPKLYGNPSKERYKVIFLGDSGVGAKTCLINRLVSNIYDDLTPSSNGASFASKFIKIKNGKEFLIDIWDTAGQEKYRGLNKHFLINTNCVILGYDCTRRESFDNIKNFWYQYVNDNAKVDLIYLIANKKDFADDEAVSEDEAKNYSKEKNMRYFPVSCKENIGIKEFWNDLCAECIKI